MEVTGLDRIKVASVSFLGFALACLIGWVGLDIFHNSSIILRLAEHGLFHLSAYYARCCRYHFGIAICSRRSQETSRVVILPVAKW